MKTFLKFAMFPIVLVFALYVIPTAVATLINTHDDAANLVLIFFISLGFGWIASYIYNKFFVTKESDDV